ncbi:bacterio-opsin activator [Halobiforma lacisalsi AJ5]|uniref:Bacterio-opsin activator n=1 Tax=Natronobacterium lacisalsi AJ5 TaxID=358396 RepID=M0LM02_NATLA|nr:helix-turn-helix domain-containing protein [Halobiforma lacisalsi]APW98523.1 bacterio-opsin activator [Halobiforma lacisalsi AJ5]EMA33050.1 bacterio-opsin activator HTH domain-containing protein [Halobiforma lacisalsi AJ5]
MALIVEYELRTPVLATVEAAAARIRLEEIYRTDADRLKLLFWATGEGLDSLRAVLTDDSNVASVSLLDDAGERRLYSVVLTEEAATGLTYPVAAEHDVVLLEAVVTDSTVVRARAPNRTALFSYREECANRGIELRLKRIYREEAWTTDRYGITNRQWEALEAALEAGYFEVPRGTTLSELATELGISDQALSARLRRGQANLLEHTIRESGPDKKG